MLGGEFASHADRSVRTFARISVKNVCAISAENLFALDRYIGRHAQGDGKFLSRSQHGIGNAGGAAGCVEQNLAVGKLATAVPSQDDAGSGAVFHRAAGIVPFGLAQKCYARKMRGELIET